MWTAVLAGDDGSGPDFEMVHFTGPGNMRAFFGCGPSAIVECIERYITKRAATDDTFRQDVADRPARRVPPLLCPARIQRVLTRRP